MSGYSVFLYVGVTTLAAAIVMLCGLQIAAIRMDRKKNRRSRMLEGPVPGCRSLSSIGLNNQSARTATVSAGRQRQQATAPRQTPQDDNQGPGPKTPTTSALPPLTKEANLNSLQTIRARSAALQTDGQSGKPAEPKPLMPAHAPSTQRPGTREIPVQEQGLAAPSTGTATVQKTPTSKRAKRANAQIETAKPGSDQAPADALADLGSLELLDTLQASPVGGSANQEDSMLDIFAGLNEAEVGLHDLTDDLNEIDGGGLPTAAPKTPQKSRR